MGTITLNHITKVEGHGRLDLEIEKGKVRRCELGSIEGSRGFESLLKGRKFNEVQEITTRICGICSSAHNVAAITAVENALDVKPSRQTIALRKLQTIGERIRSHVAHLYVLSLPDFLGYESVLPMIDSKYRNDISRSLRLMKLGNDIVRLVTGRAIHPISPAIGGFLHIPLQDNLDEIRDRLDKSHEDILATVNLIASLDFPEFERDTQYMSISRDDEFGTSQGDIKIAGKIYRQKDFHQLVKEYHEPFSTANFAVVEGKSYAVGALARLNNNRDKLSSETRKYMKSLSIKFPSKNPFHNHMAQALELMHYREECIRLLDNLKITREENSPLDLKECHGIGAVEAPRGVLWHEYKIDSNGIITYGNILTPTAQNLRNLNDDIKAYVQQMLDKKISKDKIVLEIEKLIRSYDPCFSCSSHSITINFKENQ